MNRYPQLSVRRPKLVLLIWAMLFMAMGFFIVVLPQIKINPTFKSMIMTNDPDRAFDAQAKATFGDDEYIVVAIENASGVIQIPTLELVDRLTQAIKAVPGVRDVYSLTDADNIRGSDGALLTDDLITELPKTPEDLARISRDLEENPTYTGTIVSADRTVAAINVEIAPTHAEPAIQSVVTETILALVKAEEQRSKTRIRVTGLPVSSYFGGNYMIRDMVVFGALSMILIVVVLWIAFRRFQAIVFTLIVAMCGVAGSYAVMSLLGVKVTMPLSSVMVFLMAIGMEYAIHIGYAYNAQIHETLRAGHKVRDARYMMSEGVRFMRPALIFSAVATLIGFLSMMSNPVPDLAKMGIFLCIGTAVLVIAALTLVPAIVALWPYEVKPVRESQLLHRLISTCTSSAVRRPWFHIGIMGVIIAVSVVGWTQLSSDTDAMQYFKKDSTVRQDEEFVRARMNGTTYLQAVVVGPAIDTFKEPENLRKLEEVQAYAATLPHVTKVVSHADHIKLMNRALRDGKADEYRLPETRAAVEQYLLLHNEPDDFRLVVESDYRQTSMMVRLDTMSSTVLKDVERKIEDKIRATFPPTFTGNVVGTTLLVHRAFDEMSQAMVQGLAVACLCVWIIMFVFLRSVKLATLSLLPNIIPIGMNYAVLGLIGHPIDPPAAVTGAIALGLSVDDTTHMFWTWLHNRKNKGLDASESVTMMMREVGPPIVMKSVVVGLGFCVLMFSQYGTLVWMGIMLAVVTFNGLLWDLLVTPALLRLTSMKVKKPKVAELGGFGQITNTTLDSERRELARYTDDEIRNMKVYDFFAMAGKTIIRQGGRHGTRRLLYELQLKPGATVLEFGAGVGANAFTLVKDYGVEVTCVDMSAYMIDASRRAAEELGVGDRCKFVHSTTPRLPFDDNTFDVVLAEAVLMYTDTASVVAEIFRVLKPGGKLGFHDWSWMQQPNAELEKLTNLIACSCNVDEVKFFQKDEWADQIRSGGFELGYAQEHPFAFFSWSGMVDDEGTWNVLKMFGRIMSRPAAAKKMMSIMAFLHRYEGNFGYVIMVGTKPDTTDQPPANRVESTSENRVALG